MWRCLSLQYCVKLMSNEVNPAFSDVFQSDIIAIYQVKEKVIKPLGLRIERHLDGVGFHPHAIAPYTVMKTPPLKLIVLTVCFDLCKYKSETDPTLYRLHYSELLESFTDYTHILLMDLKMAIKQMRLLCVNLLISQNVYLTRRQFSLLN